MATNLLHGGNMRLFLASSIVLAVAVSQPAFGQTAAGAASSTATFRAGVELVTVSAVVRDGKNRLVNDLRQSDFELLDSGERRPIASFRPDAAPVSVALLFDASGSMQVARTSTRRARRRAVAGVAQARIGRGGDLLVRHGAPRAAGVRETGRCAWNGEALEAISPFGMTSFTTRSRRRRGDGASEQPASGRRRVHRRG